MDRYSPSQGLTRRDFLALPLNYRRGIKLNAPTNENLKELHEDAARIGQRPDSAGSLLMRFESAFLSDVVMKMVERDRTLNNRYHNIADPIYEERPEEEREEAFSDLYRRLFVELGCEKLLREAVREFEGIIEAVDLVVVTKTRDRNEEGADLRKGQDEEGEIVMTLSLFPSHFLSPVKMRSFLHHELQHIADMLDPAFSYLPGQRLAEMLPTENLLRDRYRLLWDITIDGRIYRRGSDTVATQEDRYEEFNILFARLPKKERLLWFDKVWKTDHPTHSELLRLAKEGKGTHEKCGETQGGLCPLCQFPTYDWAQELNEDVVAHIQKDFPDWQIEMMLCKRCAEVYSVKAGQW